MTERTPKLYLVCGKAASGKSTLTATLARPSHRIVIAEDTWLSTLHGDSMTSIADYVRYAARLREVVGPHAESLLRAGMSVVLDFAANTVQTRAWMRGIAERADVPAELHYLDVPDEICKARLRRRNTSGTHPFQLSDAQFDQLSRHFEPPRAEEGFIIVRHEADS